MYVSPIHVNYTEPIVETLKDKFGNTVLRAVQEVGIEVGKDELLKALQYDRGQYEEGFNDGRAYKPPIHTNADRIRASADRIGAMSDEELAEWAATLSCCPPGYAYGDLCQPNDTCENTAQKRKCWLDWLKQEVKE